MNTAEIVSSMLEAKQPSPAASISVIIPIWRDGEPIVPLLERLRSLPAVREVIVSAAETAENLRARVESAGGIFLGNDQPNRGRQLNLGAELATAEWLLFHHVDSALDANHLRALAALDLDGVVGGAFYRSFDERHPHLRCLEKIERWHSRAFGTLYGDQSIFVRREQFQRIGGFAPIPLMEDVDLSRKLRRSGKIKLLDPPMRSCPRKQIEQGAWKITLRNLLFLLLFRCGVSVERLHSWYYSLDA